MNSKNRVAFPFNRRSDKLTKPGVKPRQSSNTKKPGRNRSAKGYDPVNKCWVRDKDNHCNLSV